MSEHPAAALDDVVHQRSRLGILAILWPGDRIEFSYLRQALNLTAGNLSRHLTMLAEAHLVTVEKGYHGRRPRTWVSITRAGSRAYAEEMSVLRSLIALADAGTTPDPAAARDDEPPDSTDAHPSPPARTPPAPTADTAGE